MRAQARSAAGSTGVPFSAGSDASESVLGVVAWVSVLGADVTGVGGVAGVVGTRATCSR